MTKKLLEQVPCPPSGKNKRHISRDEEYALIRDYQQTRSESAIEELLAAHDDYCAMRARYRSDKTGVDYEDLYQEARIGLFIAAGKFDLTRELRFLSYAGYWIEQRMQRYLDKNKTLHSRPVNMDDADQDIMKKFNALMKEREKDHGITPLTPAQESEMEEKLGHPLSKISEITSVYFGAASSLDEPIIQEDGNGTSRLDILPDFRANALEILSRESQIRYLHKALDNANLSPIERKVIRLCYLTDEDEMGNMAEIARSSGLSRERIRQLKNAALKKLRVTAEFISCCP